MINKILKAYRAHFENPQIIVKSPGRANIIGEHTDYNHGLVFPFAIEQAVSMAIGLNKLGKIRLIALDIDEDATFDLNDLSFQSEGWSRYFINSLVALEYQGTQGMDIVFGGNLPQGGGVSSSSALTCGFLSGINTLFDLGKNLDQLVSLASQAENGIGLNGGTMDQTSILKGKDGKALMIDFLDFSVKEFEMPDARYNFYLFNSGQKHNLVDTEYNKRRATCDYAVRKVADSEPSVKTLRDMTIDHVNELLDDEVSKKRCTHVLGENARVIEASQLLMERNYEALGPLLLSSHNSLSNLYNVSTSEIDYLVKRSQEISNVLGSRIMGGGFGGCTINFVKGEISALDIEKLKLDYSRETGYELAIHRIKASHGVKVDKI